MFDNTRDEWPLSDPYHFGCMCQHFLITKLTEMDKELKEGVTSHGHILEKRLNRPGPHTNFIGTASGGWVSVHLSRS